VNIKMLIGVYAEVDVDGNPQFLGLDSYSGGYPYKTTSFMQAKVWSDVSKFVEYMKHFHDENVFLKEVDITIPQYNESLSYIDPKVAVDFIRHAEEHKKGKSWSEGFSACFRGAKNSIEVFMSQIISANKPK